MSSNAQNQANQTNAQKSIGPRTEEGKARARYNARRHGLTGQFYVMDDDDRQAYLTFETGLVGDMQPVGAYEHQLAVSISQDHWRMNRVKGIEFNTMGLGHHEQSDSIHADSAQTETAVAHARTWRADNKAFANMALYESRLHRIINRNKRELDELQAKRQVAEARAREEAELILANELSKQPSEPIKEENIQVDGAQQSGLIPTSLMGLENIQVNGFVFSIKATYQEMAWKQTLAEARWYQSQNWDRTKQPPFALLNFPKAA